MKRDDAMRHEQINQQTENVPAICTLATRLLIALICGLAFGQATTARAQEMQLGFDFLTVFPRGEFRDNISNNGYGASGHFLVRVKQSPLLVGVDVGGVVYGSETRRERLLPDVPDVRVDVTTKNNIFLTHFLVRAQPRHGAVRPYVDGLIGFKYLYTNTSIDIDAENSPSDTNLSDVTLSYGVGGGVQVQLTSSRRRPVVLLDAGVRYLRGGRAEYLREGSISRKDGAVFFDVLRSRTDVVTAQVGVTFRF
jgi:opacity protein-like surface antigen